MNILNRLLKMFISVQIEKHKEAEKKLSKKIKEYKQMKYIEKKPDFYILAMLKEMKEQEYNKIHSLEGLSNAA